MQRLREMWEADRIASEAQPEGGWKCDPDHPPWPRHRNRGDPSCKPRLATVYESDEEKSSSTRASTGIIKPLPSSPPFRTLSDLSFASADASSHPDAAELAALDAESAFLDRELSGYEPLPHSTPETEDRLWRERVRYGRYSERDRCMYKGDGCLARGCRDPFDGSLERKGRGDESPLVSPRSMILTVKVEQQEEEGSDGVRAVWGKPVAAKEDSDGEMPVSPRTVLAEEGESDGELT